MRKIQDKLNYYIEIKAYKKKCVKMKHFLQKNQKLFPTRKVTKCK